MTVGPLSLRQLLASDVKTEFTARCSDQISNLVPLASVRALVFEFQQKSAVFLVLPPLISCPAAIFEALPVLPETVPVTMISVLEPQAVPLMLKPKLIVVTPLFFQ